MAALEYKLEYYKGAGGGATDDGAFIHLRTDSPAYQQIISKETYWSAENSASHTDLVNHLFDVPGVVRLACQAWRIYVEKSPVFKWDEVMPGVLNVLQTDTSSTSLSELPGSGLTLASDNDRRGF